MSQAQPKRFPTSTKTSPKFDFGAPLRKNILSGIAFLEFVRLPVALNKQGSKTSNHRGRGSAEFESRPAMLGGGAEKEAIQPCRKFIGHNHLICSRALREP
jgi:hypothetical protein